MLSLLFFQISSASNSNKFTKKSKNKFAKSNNNGKFFSKQSSKSIVVPVNNTNCKYKSNKKNNIKILPIPEMMQRRSAPTTAQNRSSSPLPIAIAEERRRRSDESGGGGGIFSSIIDGLRRHGRRGVREDGTGEDEDQLLIGIQALQTTVKFALEMAEAQRKAAGAFGKWAKGANNNAMADLVGRTSELLAMSAERGTKFAEDNEKSLKQLLKRLEVLTKRIKKEKKNFDKYYELERQLTRAICISDNHLLRVQLAQAIADREEAGKKLAHERVEAEVSRIYGLQEGLKKIADAQWTFAKQMEMISACQRELVEYVPTISSRDICQMNYTGLADTRQRVAQLRRSLESAQNQMPSNFASSNENRERNLRRPTHPPPLPIPANANDRQHQQQHSDQQQQRRIREPAPPPPLNFHSNLGFPLTPPPPYTPTAPPFELSDSAAGTPISRTGRNNPNRHSTGPNLLLTNSNNSSIPTRQHPPSSSSMAADRNRIYPKLGPNPFAESQRLRQHQREEEEEGISASGWLESGVGRN